MHIGTILLLVVLGLTGLFAVLNWAAFNAPVPLSLGVTSVEAPIGLVMLGVLTVVSLLFAASALTQQGRALLELRRHGRELQAQRQLADQAEASRFTALQNAMQAEMERTRRHLDTRATEIRQALQDSGNTLAAYIGEVEDKVERGFGTGGAAGAVGTVGAPVPR